METTAALTEKFETILKDVLNLKDFSFANTMQAKDIPGWNSLNHLMVIVALEKGFNIRFTIDEATQTENIGDLKSLIQTKMR